MKTMESRPRGGGGVDLARTMASGRGGACAVGCGGCDGNGVAAGGGGSR